jgi:apolipoprotein N-acyltransferase
MIPLGHGRWAAWPALPLAGMLAAVLGYGYVRTAVEQPEPVARIALIQESIDITFKTDPEMFDEIHRRYLVLSEEAVERYSQPRKPDLIVWPETMFRHTLIDYGPDARPPEGWDRSVEDFRRALPVEAAASRMRLGEIPRLLGTAMLLGVDTTRYGRDGQQYFNSAVLVNASGEIAGRYDKVHLVLFGEYVPFAQYWPWLQRFTPLSVNSTAGSRPVAFDVRLPRGGLRIAPGICYENVLAHVVRRQIADLARRGREPDVLVNLTNDGWFWGSSELDMHLVCAVFRAVEFRKPFLVAANTGFSAWIDGDGRVRAQGPRRDKGIILAEVGPDPRSSLYFQYGDWPAGVCLAVCVVLGAIGSLAWHRDRMKRRNLLARKD